MKQDWIKKETVDMILKNASEQGIIHGDVESIVEDIYNYEEET